jgi:hypothetical protein
MTLLNIYLQKYALILPHEGKSITDSHKQPFFGFVKVKIT